MWHLRFREDIEDLVKLTVDKMDAGYGKFTLASCFYSSTILQMLR